jgi:hypothetical protein
MVARDLNPIVWERDITPAKWLGGLARSTHCVDELVPAGYEAYARLWHPPGRHFGTGLADEERALLVDVLRSETATPRCWFCVADDRKEIDDQGVTARVQLPTGRGSYLLHAGPIERALVPPPQRPLPFVLREGATMPEMEKELAEKLHEYSDVMIWLSADDTPAALMEHLAALLDGVAPELWWPEDHAWFVSTPAGYGIDATYVGGSRRLVDRLLATPGLEAIETTLTESLGVARMEQRERTFGPIIARGDESGHEWTMRGRIGEDGAWHSIHDARGSGGGGGGGALPFQDVGWKQLGHFGGFGHSFGPDNLPQKPSHIDGVVSRETASIEVHLTDGSVIPAQIVDIGDPRASFFVAHWTAPFQWERLVARDAAGNELETRRHAEPPGEGDTR